MSQLRGPCVLTALALVAFMTVLDSIVLNVPRIQRDLGLGLSDLEWVGGLPAHLYQPAVGGRPLGDAWGAPTDTGDGPRGFTASSLLCSLAHSGTALTFYRAPQGIGAALILPASLAVLTHDVPPRTRNIGVAVWTIAPAAALALGPVASGLISQRLGWHWCAPPRRPAGQ